MSRLNLWAAVLCLGGLALVATVVGPSALVAPDAAWFTGTLALAGLLFLLAATGRTVGVAGRRVDLHDCSGLGDVSVGAAIACGLASIPPGPVGTAYTLLVIAGSVSAVLFGVVGLREKRRE